LEAYANKLAETVSNYQEKVSDLIEYLEKIDVELSALEKCQYKETVISQILGSIQKTVESMALNNYSNMNKWIENLDSMVHIIKLYNLNFIQKV
jgi:Ni,Fe-hydrogenase maturation factor